MKIQQEIIDYLRAVGSATFRNIDRALAFAGLEADMRDIEHALQVLIDNEEIREDSGIYTIALS